MESRFMLNVYLVTENGDEEGSPPEGHLSSQYLPFFLANLWQDELER